MTRSARDGMPDDAVNIHASAVVLDDGAVLITGPAGAGKSHLALALIEAWHGVGRFARLLADDQVFVMPRDGKLVARTPRAIAGLAEIRGVGIVELPHEPEAVVHLVVDLVDGNPPDGHLSTVRIEAVDLPLLTLKSRDTDASRDAISAAIAAIRTTSGRENA